MADTKRDPVGLAAAAQALEAELARFDELGEALARERLDSAKNLRRAAQSLVALQDVEVRLGEHLAALLKAMGAARERQESRAVAVRDRAEMIRQRSEALSALMQRWEALGREAAEVTGLAQQATAARDASNGEPRDDVSSVFEQLDGRLGSLAESAEAMVDAAKGVDFDDLARHADGLRLQVLAVRNKLRLARGVRA